MTDDYLVTCDYSGFVCKRSECVVQWNGLLVRKDFADMERHPQDFIPECSEAPFAGISRQEPKDPAMPDNENAWFDKICFYDLNVSYNASVQLI